MSAILTPTIYVVAIGLILAAILTIASKIFFVPVDETVSNLNEALPGANCGACGYAGCSDYAEAIVNGDPVNKCPVGGAEVASALAEIMGVDAGDSEKIVAVVQCNGNCDATERTMDYQGMATCQAANQLYGGAGACSYGCLGIGDCVVACDFNAIHICNGVAVVDREKCVGCGACAKACPKSIIRMAPEKNKVIVQCHSNAKPKDTMKACKNGCIGCSKCAKVCKFDSITVEDGLAYIDPETCKNCGLCQKECPTGAIINMRVKKPAVKKAE